MPCEFHSVQAIPANGKQHRNHRSRDHCASSDLLVMDTEAQTTPKRKSVARLAEGQKHGAGLLPPPMSFDHDI